MQRLIQTATRLMPVMRAASTTAVRHSSASGKRSVVGGLIDFYKDDPAVYDQRYIDFFDRPDIDGWMIRQGGFKVSQIVQGSCWP